MRIFKVFCDGPSKTLLSLIPTTFEKGRRDLHFPSQFSPVVMASVRLSLGSQCAPGWVALALPASCSSNTLTAPMHRGLESGLCLHLSLVLVWMSFRRCPWCQSWGPEEPRAVALPSMSPLCYLQIYNSSSNLLGKWQPSPVATSWVKRSFLGRWFSMLLGSQGGRPTSPVPLGGGAGTRWWLQRSLQHLGSVLLYGSGFPHLPTVSHYVMSCHTGPGWGTPVGDWGQPAAADALLR